MSNLSKEEKQELNKYIDSIELGTSTDDTVTPYKNTYSVWKVPIIGHMVILNTKDKSVKACPMLNSAFDFDSGIEGLTLGEHHEIKAILPALPGEHVIQAIMPVNPVNIDYILNNDFYEDTEIVTLCHCVPGVPEINWKDELRVQLFGLAKTNITESSN